MFAGYNIHNTVTSLSLANESVMAQTTGWLTTRWSSALEPLTASPCSFARCNKHMKQRCTERSPDLPAALTGGTSAMRSWKDTSCALLASWMGIMLCHRVSFSALTSTCGMHHHAIRQQAYTTAAPEFCAKSFVPQGVLTFVTDTARTRHQ